jgi:pimeloyl-ACP methyl ester carboxylesterase
MDWRKGRVRPGGDMNYTEKLTKTRGGDVLMRRGGKGPTLLFLHGAGGAAGSEPFFDKLAERFDLIAPDHPSFGRSPLPPWLEDISDLAYFYLDLIDELNLKDVHVVGHSMGGWLALEIAIRSQARMKSLTLLSSVGIRLKGNPVANVFIMTPDQLMNSLFADPKIVAAELARVPTSEQLDEIVTNKTSAARLGWHPRFFNPRLARWLHRVKVPTQILWGKEDKIVSPLYADEFKRLIPHASVQLFPGAGHIPYAEKLDDTTSAIGNFVMRNA